MDNLGTGEKGPSQDQPKVGITQRLPSSDDRECHFSRDQSNGPNDSPMSGNETDTDHFEIDLTDSSVATNERSFKVVRRKRKKQSLSDSDKSSKATKRATDSGSFKAPQSFAHAAAPKLDAPTGPTGAAAKIPAITIYPDNTRLAEINRQFKAKYDPYFFMAIKVKDGVRLQTSTYKDYINLQRFLEEHNVPHHIYRLSNERTYKVVLRGIDEETYSSEVKTDLESRGIEVLKVSQMRGHFNKRPLPMFLVELPSDKVASSVLELKEVLHMKVRAEAYKPPKTPTQCFRCQRFGHTTSCCKARPRCVKCGQEHGSKDCEATREDFKCVLCGKSHTASYRGCEAHKQAARNINARKEKLNVDSAKPTPHTRPSAIPRHTRPNVSYAQASIQKAASTKEVPLTAPTETTVPAASVAPKAPKEKAQPPLKEKVIPAPKEQPEPVPRGRRTRRTRSRTTPRADKQAEVTQPDTGTPATKTSPPQNTTRQPNSGTPDSNTDSLQNSIEPILKMLNPAFTWDAFLPAFLQLLLSLMTSPNTTFSSFLTSLLNTIKSVNNNGQ